MGDGTQGPGHTGTTIVCNHASSPVDVLEVFDDLLESTRDREYGFSTFADPVETARVEELLFSRAEGCRVVGEKLIRLTR